jgi:hypothetical protein
LYISFRFLFSLVTFVWVLSMHSSRGRLRTMCGSTRGLVFHCVLGSEGCVLVPRSSGTPVATWACPTWVVSRRRVLEAMLILLEFPSPSRRIYRLPFTAPLSGSPYRSFDSPPPLMAPWRLASTLSSLRTPWLLRGCKRLLDGMDS